MVREKSLNGGTAVGRIPLCKRKRTIGKLRLHLWNRLLYGDRSTSIKLSGI